MSPAVVALLNKAGTQERSGNHEQAADSLERALQIEPGHAWLWHRLAQVRLDQGRNGQAVSLAAKSNSMAAGNEKLTADNWRLIAEARKRQGDLSGAREALDKASLSSGNR